MNTATHDTHIAEYSATEAGLAELRERLTGVLYSVETTKGMEAAVRDRADVRGIRTALERKRVELKAPALDFSRRIDSEAKRITGLLEEIEAPIDSVIRAEQSRKEAEKQERINSEFGRIAAIQEAIGEIHLTVQMAAGKGSERITAAIAEVQAFMMGVEVFQEFLADAKAAQSAALVKLDLMMAAALHVEAEAAKFAAERAELAELRAANELQKVESKKQAAFDRAEMVRLQAESAALIAAQQAEIARQRDELAASTLAHFLSVDAKAAAENAAPFAPTSLEEMRQLLAPAPVTPVVEVAADAPDISSGDIQARLKFWLDVTLLYTLGFKPSRTGRETIWREADFRPICAALIRHIQGVAA